MKRKKNWRKIVAMLLTLMLALPMSAQDAWAAVGALSNVDTGLQGNIDTSDTISLPIKIYDYEADGMLFEYAESIAAKDANDFGATWAEDYTTKTAVGGSINTGNYWSDVSLVLKTGTYANYTRTTWVGNTTANWTGNRAGVVVADFSESSTYTTDQIRYMVVVFRSNVRSGNFTVGLNRANLNGAGTNGNYTGNIAVTTENSTNWTYAVLDLKTGTLGSNWSKGAVYGVYVGLPIDASGEWMDIAHVAFFSDQTKATQFGEYALTDGNDRGDNRGFGLLRSSRNQGDGTNYEGIVDETKTVKQLNTYGDTTSIDLSTLDTLGYTLYGTFKTDGIANLGLLESSLNENGYPVYKEEVVTYVANLLKHSLEIPERTSDGWKNYRYVKGTASSIYGGADLATALRTRINEKMGLYSESAGKKLVGTWSECEKNITSYYDAAYFLLNSIFVSGSYNEEQDDYNYLVLAKATATDGEVGYVFDGGFTTSATPSSAENAVEFDSENKTISNSTATGKTHFYYENSNTTTLNPFLPVTDKNNATGQTQTPYIQDDGVLSTGTTKDTYVNRNFNYVMVGEGEFVYHADDELFFEFEGDDDVYLFINGELVMDIGSAHSIDGTKFYLNDYVNAAKAGKLGSAERNQRLSLVEGNSYSFKFCYMERHGYGANIRINTNIRITDPSMVTEKTAYQDDKQIEYGSIVDKDKTVEYGFALTNNGNTNLYNLSFADNDIGLKIDYADGLTTTGNNVFDAQGGELEVNDLYAVVSGEGYNPITVAFKNNDELKAFLKNVTGDDLLESGAGLWVGSTVQMRGFAYKLTDAQIKAGVFDNTVQTSAWDVETTGTGNYITGQATMRVFVPADPMYYQWSGHAIKVGEKKLVEDVLAAARQEGNILEGKVPELTENNVNSIITCTSSGNAFSYDEVTIDDDYDLTINYSKTGSYVFYVQITYNDSANTVIVPVLVNVPDVENSVYVLDYGLSVDLTENNELFKNDTLTVPGRSTTSQILAIGSTEPSYSPNNINFAVETSNSINGADGMFTLAEQKLTYTPENFMDEMDKIWTAVTVRESDYRMTPVLGDVDINNEVQMYKSVTTLPATVVYYEDNFPAIHYTDYTGEDALNVFTQVSDNSNLTQSADQTQNYGQDATYANNSNTDESGNSLTTITIKESGQVAYFDFTGTGFELIGRTNAYDSATINVKVYNLTYESGKAVQGTTPVKSIPVITEFDNGANGGEEEIYQVPIIRVDNLTKGAYRVVISGIPARDYTNLDATGTPAIIPTNLYIDGLRIFQPMGATNDSYTAAENGAIFEEIRDLIVNGKVAVAKYDGENTEISTGTITWTENRNGTTYDGELFTGNQVGSVNDYLTLGPNNEVYMNGTYETAALVFYVEENEAAVHNLQIAVRGVDSGLFFGSNSTGIKAPIQYGIKSGNTFSWMPLVTTVSATEQYYTIDYIKCPYIEGRGYQVAIQVDSGMVSYTSLKYNGLTLGTMDAGEVTTLYYDNGVLKAKTDTGTGVLLDVEDYPVFYSIRAQLTAETVSSGEIVKDGNVSDSKSEENIVDGGTVEGDDGIKEDGKIVDEGNIQNGNDTKEDGNTGDNGNIEDSTDTKESSTIGDNSDTEDKENIQNGGDAEIDNTEENYNSGNSRFIDIIGNILKWLIGVIRSWFTK